MGCPSDGCWETYFLDIKTPSIWDSNVPSADPDKWKRSVSDVLQRISQSATGSALLRSMKRMAQWIDVYPLQRNECNAHGFATGRRVINGREYLAQIQFNPDVYMSGSACYKNRHRSYGKEPDQVLFHEMIHAHRGASWLLPEHEKLIAGLSGYSNEEEFLAVVLTNIYISETRGRGLRADYYSYDELKGPLSTSIGFFQNSPQVLRILTQFSEDQTFLFDELAKVKAPFNPVAAMKEHPDQVAKMSYSKAAMERERTAPKAAAAQLERIKKDARLAKEQQARELRHNLASHKFSKDLAGMLAQAALHFLPR